MNMRKVLREPSMNDDTRKRRGHGHVDAPLTDDEFERGYGAMLARTARAATGYRKTRSLGNTAFQSQRSGIGSRAAACQTRVRSATCA